MVGGQAVAWWVQIFGIPTDKPVTSSDIDFRGSRDDLKALSKALGAKPVWPHEYEMTVWVGGIPLTINAERTIVDFIRSVPGLDVIYPEKASVGQTDTAGAVARRILVLSPISLVLAKLHGPKAFDQDNRQDELHLKVCLLASKIFLTRLINTNFLFFDFYILQSFPRRRSRAPSRQAAAAGFYGCVFFVSLSGAKPLSRTDLSLCAPHTRRSNI
jgi:hypothetical protein